MKTPLSSAPQRCQRRALRVPPPLSGSRFFFFPSLFGFPFCVASDINRRCTRLPISEAMLPAPWLRLCAARRRVCRYGMSCAHCTIGAFYLCYFCDVIWPSTDARSNGRVIFVDPGPHLEAYILSLKGYAYFRLQRKIRHGRHDLYKKSLRL